MDPRVVNAPRLAAGFGEIQDADRIMADAHAMRAQVMVASLRWMGRILSWPVRAAIIRPFRSWRRRERIRVGVGGLGDNVLHDIGMTRDRLPYLVARERDRHAA